MFSGHLLCARPPVSAFVWLPFLIHHHKSVRQVHCRGGNRPREDMGDIQGHTVSKRQAWDPGFLTSSPVLFLLHPFILFSHALSCNCKSPSHHNTPLSKQKCRTKTERSLCLGKIPSQRNDSVFTRQSTSKPVTRSGPSQCPHLMRRN